MKSLQKMWITAASRAALALALPIAALAAPADQVKVAIEQAGLAAKAGTLVETQDHLQQVINCLVGPGGKAFKAKATNPCATLGKGAIAETQDVLNKEKLQRAAAAAREAIGSKDAAAVTLLTQRVRTQLESVHY